MKVLKLTLKKVHFDQINAEIKLAEYREIKPYWLQRLVDTSNYPAEDKDDYKTLVANIWYDIHHGMHNPEKAIKAYFCKLCEYTHVEFTNGYGNHRPRILVECEGISIGTGNPDWGATPDQTFIIHLGAIIERHNIK